MPVLNSQPALDKYGPSCTIENVFPVPNGGGWFSLDQNGGGAYCELQYGTGDYGSGVWTDEQLLGPGAFGTIPPKANGIRFRNAVAGKQAVVTAAIAPHDQPALGVNSMGQISVVGATLNFKHNGAPVALEPILDFIDAAGLSWSIIDDASGTRIKVSAKNLYAGIYNVKDFGAVGDGVADDTVYIQAAITAALGSTSGGCVYLPPGTYKITAALDIPFSTGWLIRGASPASTSIIQFTDNTPIFRITQSLTWGWEIRDLALDYNSSQAAGNTAACPVYVNGGANAGAVVEVFNFRLTNVHFSRGSYGIGVNAARYSTVWGMWVEGCTFNSGLTGGVCNLFSAQVEGMPNNRFSHCYIRADNMVGPLWDCSYWEQGTFVNVEINVASQAPTLVWDGGTGATLTFITFKLEGGTYTSGSNPMFYFGNGVYNFEDLRISTITATAGWSGPIFRDASGAGTNINITNLSVAGWTHSGTHYVFTGGGTSSVRMTVDDIVYGGLPAGLYLTNIPATATGDNVVVRAWQRGLVSTDKGDADYTVVVGDPNIVWYGTALTATRTVTLPRGDGGIDVNLFNGLSYRIVRLGGGAGDLNIQTPTGFIDSIPSGKTGVIEYTYRRLVWVRTLKALV